MSAMVTSKSSAKKPGDRIPTTCKTRTGLLPDGVWLEEIMVYAKTDEISRLVHMMEIAGYEVVDRRGNNVLDNTYSVALFHRHDHTKDNPFIGYTKTMLVNECVARGIDWESNLRSLTKDQLTNLLLP